MLNIFWKPSPSVKTELDSLLMLTLLGLIRSAAKFDSNTSTDPESATEMNNFRTNQHLFGQDIRHRERDFFFHSAINVSQLIERYKEL